MYLLLCLVSLGHVFSCSAQHSQILSPLNARFKDQVGYKRTLGGARDVTDALTLYSGRGSPRVALSRRLHRVNKYIYIYTMAQASGSTTASDNELRSALKKLGFMPGPITDSTRGLYLEKLKQLKTSTAPGRNSSATKTPLSQSITPPAAAARRKVSTPTSRDPGSSTCKLTPSFPSPPLPLPHSNSSLVITQLLHSLNNSSHLASDTAFLFPDGDVFLASRAVLSTQCSEMTPLLYSREGELTMHVCIPILDE